MLPGDLEERAASMEGGREGRGEGEGASTDLGRPRRVLWEPCKFMKLSSEGRGEGCRALGLLLPMGGTGLGGVVGVLPLRALFALYIYIWERCKPMIDELGFCTPLPKTSDCATNCLHCMLSEVR